MGDSSYAQPVVRLFGRTRVRDCGGEAVEDEAWRTAKTLDLLRVLALSPGTPVANDVLVDLFWAAAGPSRGGTSLRAAACHLRRVLGAASIVRVGHGLMLEASVDVDAYRVLVARVDAAVRDGSPARVAELVRRAEELYVGDLDLTGSDCVDLHEAREELRAQRMALLLDGAEAAGRCADWRQSLSFAQRAAEIEVTDRSTRALMRAWYALGEAAKPVEEFERLRRRLSEDYGVDPAPQTRALYLEVVGACREWPPRETVVGREVEVAQVVTAAMAWLMDPETPGGVVWLVGDPGSGRHEVAGEARRVMMLPLADDTADLSADPGADAYGPPSLEVLEDQGLLTRGLAQVLTDQAHARRRILLVPVTGVEDVDSHQGDALVAIGPLAMEDFRRLLRLVLQGEPTPELASSLYEETRGLPGLASRTVRERVASGELTWTPRGVGATLGARIRSKIVPALVSVPFALIGLFGGEGVIEAATKVVEIEQRERKLVLSR